MALYSVWDWPRNAYRVYMTPTHVSVGDDPLPPRPSGISVLGADPDTDMKPLPAGARFIGYEHVARGEIRRAPRRWGDLGDDAGAGGAVASRSGLFMFSLGLAVASAYFWWRDSKRSL